MNHNCRLAALTAIVTGAGQGIGQAIATRLADEGAQVMVMGRSPAPIESTVAAIRQRGGRAVSKRGDIANPADVASAVGETIERWGRVDILVNNAAVLEEPSFFDLDVATFRETLDTNVTGTFLMSQAVARHMARAGSGSIVHLSSVAALGADGPFTAYPATKAAVISLAQTMTRQLAPLGIRVNCVSPGFVNTEMVQKTSTPRVMDHMLNDFARVPMRRLVSADEIAAAVAFLASNEASAITGANLVVDCGLASNLFVVETLPDPILSLSATHEG